MFAKASQFAAIFSSPRTAIPNARPCVSLALVAILCSPPAGAAQDDSLATAAIQLERTAKAALLADRGMPQGFYQLGDSKVLLAAATATMKQGDTYRECSTKEPATETDRMMNTFLAKLPSLAESTDAVLEYKENAEKANAAARTIADSTHTMHGLLSELIDLQKLSAPQGPALAMSTALRETSGRVHWHARHFLSAHNLEPEVAFEVGRSETRFTSALQKMLAGSKDDKIAPPTPEEKAKLAEINTLFKDQSTAIKFLITNLSAYSRFKTAAEKTFGTADQLSRELANARNKMAKEKICKVSGT